MGENCGKGFLYFHNLIYLGIAGTLAYLSIKYVQEWGIYTSLVLNTYAIVPAGIIMVLAILILVTATVGFCGVWNENRCTLGSFMFLLLFVLTAEIVGGSLTYVHMDSIKTDMEINLKESFKKYHDDTLTIKKSFDYMQRRLRCCGVDSPNDWNTTSKVIPESCCIHDTGPNCSQYPNNVFEKGCYIKIFNHFKENLKYVVSITLGVAVYQVVGILMAIYLIFVLKKRGYMRMSDAMTKMT